MKKNLVLLVAVGVFAACGGDDEPARHDVNLKPVSPTGTVVGTVTDVAHQPLAGATVRAEFGSKVRTTTVDENGYFSFTKVPAGGSIGLRIEAEGYTAAQLSTVIPNEAGEQAISGTSVSVGPVALVPTTDSFSFRLIGEDGRLLNGEGAFCEAQGTWLEGEAGDEVLRGRMFVDAETSDDGSLLCDGLPRFRDLIVHGAEVLILVPGIDVDGDGMTDYHGVAESISAALLVETGSGTMNVSLQKRDTAVDIVGTNVATLDGGNLVDSVIDGAEGVNVSFFVPAVVHYSRVTEEGSDELIDHEVVNTYGRIELRPVGGAWAKGRNMHVELAVAPASKPLEVEVLSGRFLTASDGLPAIERFFFIDTNGNGELDNGEDFSVELTQAVGLVNSGAIPVAFDFDVDGSGDVGDASGELGSDAPVPAFDERFFSRFFSGTWGYGSVPAGAEAQVSFDFLLSEDEPGFTTSGRMITGSLQGELTAVAP